MTRRRSAISPDRPHGSLPDEPSIDRHLGWSLLTVLAVPAVLLAVSHPVLAGVLPASGAASWAFWSRVAAHGARRESEAMERRISEPERPLFAR